MGRGVIGYALPGRLRLLFPFLVAPDHRGIPEEQRYWGWRWLWYQALRFLFLWAALYVDARAYGTAHAAACGALAGLTFRFDYWSNCVELLAACLVCSAGVLGIPIWWGVACGLVLGLGRETLPLLALSLNPFGVVLGAAAAVSAGAVRIFGRTLPEWERVSGELQYGWPQWRYNLALLWRPPCVAAPIEAVLYVGLAGLASVQAPLLTVALVAVTVCYARMDEPRVLTMLAPWAASTLIHLWR